MQQYIVDCHFNGFDFSQSLGNKEDLSAFNGTGRKKGCEICIGPVWRMVSGRSLVI